LLKFQTDGIWLKGDSANSSEKNYYCGMEAVRLKMQSGVDSIGVPFAVGSEREVLGDVVGSIVGGGENSILKVEAVMNDSSYDTLSNVSHPDILIHGNIRKIIFDSNYICNSEQVRFKLNNFDSVNVDLVENKNSAMFIDSSEFEELYIYSLKFNKLNQLTCILRRIFSSSSLGLKDADVHGIVSVYAEANKTPAAVAIEKNLKKLLSQEKGLHGKICIHCTGGVRVYKSRKMLENELLWPKSAKSNKKETWDMDIEWADYSRILFTEIGDSVYVIAPEKGDGTFEVWFVPTKNPRLKYLYQAVKVNTIESHNIRIGFSETISPLQVGKVYIPTRYGGELEITGDSVALYYNNGDQTIGNELIDVYNGKSTYLIAACCSCKYTIPANEYRYYYIKVKSDVPVTITVNFSEGGYSEERPWNGWYWPFSDRVEPNLHSNTGSYTPLLKYDLALSTSTLREERDWCLSTCTSIPEGDCPAWFGHCWGWALASTAFGQPDSGEYNGIRLNQDEAEGLLTELADDADALGWHWIVGHPENPIPAWSFDKDGENVDRIVGSFHSALQENIKQSKFKMFGNLRANRKIIDENRKPVNSDEIWNHSIFGYSAKYKEIGEFFYEITVKMYSNNDLLPPPTDSSTSRVDAYLYNIEYKSDGRVKTDSFRNNWKRSSGWIPECIGIFTDEDLFKNNLKASHCSITISNVERFK
ncbi:MAG: hypothetical protein JXA91_04275, partial [Candidatus Thermoplasmatota archaeon]|nr:hypothetical protein [Candidatus Thermoplasmatota archaeon]